MAYDEDLANRIREAVQDESGVREKAMFGGLETEQDFRRWVGIGITYVRSLPPK